MKKLKFFLLRYKDRILRFFAAFSAFCLVFSSSASALSSYYILGGAPFHPEIKGYTPFHPNSDIWYDDGGSGYIVAAVNSSGNQFKSYAVRNARALSDPNYAFTTVTGIRVSIPFDVQVPNGNYWALSGRLGARYRVQGGSLQNLVLNKVNIAYYDNDSATFPVQNVLDYNNSAQDQYIRFTTDKRLRESTVTLDFSFECNISASDLYTFYLDFYDFKIIYGLEQEFLPEYQEQYTSPDGSAVSEFHDDESALLSDTQNGRDQASSLFSGFTSLIGNGTRIYKGLLAVKRIIDSFIGASADGFSLESFIYPLLYFVLVLGLVSFVLGSANIIMIKGQMGMDRHNSYSRRLMSATDRAHKEHLRSLRRYRR